ncbi:hypothetical protein ERJ75_001264700 [Trypanosoma vivax]|nr:hypothetical protein ERJ75_001264700 [Trypanosoma vivax]
MALALSLFLTCSSCALHTDRHESESNRQCRAGHFVRQRSRVPCPRAAPSPRHVAATLDVANDPHTTSVLASATSCQLAGHFLSAPLPVALRKCTCTLSCTPMRLLPNCASNFARLQHPLRPGRFRKATLASSAIRRPRSRGLAAFRLRGRVSGRKRARCRSSKPLSSPRSTSAAAVTGEATAKLRRGWSGSGAAELRSCDGEGDIRCPLRLHRRVAFRVDGSRVATKEDDVTEKMRPAESQDRLFVHMRGRANGRGKRVDATEQTLGYRGLAVMVATMRPYRRRRTSGKAHRKLEE